MNHRLDKHYVAILYNKVLNEISNDTKNNAYA